MTNDTSTLSGALQELGETMADNLVAMGVTGADASDGLTTLAGKILDIEPSVGGLDLTSEMSLTTSSNSITLGQSVVLTATLTANYDDETLVNVDLHGYLQGATVSFKSGNTVIGTATTDVNGVATYTYTPASTGTLSLTAVFEGTDNFSSATSSSVSVVVSAPAPASISVSSDKSVLSYYDEESATLTATVLDSNGNGCSGETVTFTFKHGSTTVETQTATTGSGGVASVSYSSKGTGDLSIQAGVRSLVSETFVLEDCLFYGINVNAFTVPSNTTFTSDGTKITAATSTSGEKLVYFDHTFSNNDNWLFETELAEVTTPQSMAIIFNDNSYYGGQYPTQTNKAFTNMGSNVITSHTFATGDKYKVVRENGVTTAYINDTSIQSKTTSHKTSFKVGYYITQNRTQYYKNIKVKPIS